jgi:Proteobacterial lipase chaperone protein
MLAIATPSIVQQRIVLVVFLVVIGALVWWQNAGGSSDYPVQKFSQTPVPDVFDELDFTMAEAAWSGLTIDSQGNLKIDALTETALVDAMALMQGQTSELSMARMAFLLEKQFGATASEQIMELVPILTNYKEAEKRWWEENGSKNPPPHAELFQLQDELLGETLAKKMFSEQRRLVNMMLASHQIRTDASLTQTEKDQALMDLQETLQKEGARIE